MNDAGKAVNTAEDFVPEEELTPGEGDFSEITEDNLFEKVESGEISLEEANAFLNGQEEEVSPSGNPAEEGNGEGDELDGYGAQSEESDADFADANNVSKGAEAEDAVKPFRVFNTQEDFQRMVDKNFNKRYGKMMHEQEVKNQEHRDLLSDLGELLGVAPDQAAAELKNRKRRLEAEKLGVDPDEFSSRKAAEDERDRYKAQLEQQQKQANARAVVENIRSQGANITKTDKNFNIDDAMNNNQEFAKMVFALLPSMPDRAVALAYREFYGGKAPQAQPAAPAAAPGRRAPEGGAGGIRGDRKPVDYSRMSDADILKLQEDIIAGRKQIPVE